MADNNKKQLLSQNILRNLGDRSYEKRKSAASEIEALVKEINQADSKSNPSASAANSSSAAAASSSSSSTPSGEGPEKIRAIINHLTTGFVGSPQANSRKGGLIGLAATSIALASDTTQYLNSLLAPVMNCLQDQDVRVRYYACEALYNITKVVRGQVLICFNKIFDGLCKLFTDTDEDVKNGANLLDRLLQDVVTEHSTFEVQAFIPMLREKVHSTDPNIRRLLVSWVTVLDSVPALDMLQYLPEYLGGIFDMLSDNDKDIRAQAYSALAEFLREISQSPTVDLGKMVLILVLRCESHDNFTRLTALTWMHEFILLGKTKLLPFSAVLMGACLHCISDPEEEIRAKSDATNSSLLQLLETTEEKFDVDPLLAKLTVQVRSMLVPTKLAALRWISMLLTKIPHTIYKHLDELFPALLQTLSDADDQVVRLDIEVLARISLDQDNFDLVLNNLFKLFAADRKLLEKRGSLIIRQLSVLLNGESIFRAFARILATASDMEFCGLMVQTLNLILLTSSELFELRSGIKNSLLTEDGRELFTALYKSWCHNPVATFSLCLLAQAYELASALAFAMADIEVTVGFLMQIDKLVQLIESPIFIHLRLQLLEPARHPFLLKSLYGLLMLLPQSAAFTSLKTRLDSVSTLGLLNCIPDSKFAVSSNPEKRAKEANQPINFGALLDEFRSIQLKHTSLRKELFNQNSLLTNKKTVDDSKAN